MSEHYYSLYERWNVFFQGTFWLMVLGFTLMEPHGLAKVIHVTKLDQLLQWHDVKNRRI